MYKKPFIIAEAGCNHMGQLNIAHDMIKIASKYCKVDAIKFQKRCPKELLTKEQYNAPHPNPINSFGKTYGEHREFLEFNIEEHKLLKQWCEEEGIIYSTSVWDLTSAKEITSLQPKYIKVPSACNTNYEMLLYLCDNFNGEIQISFGMTNDDEKIKIIKLFEQKNRLKDLIVYACTSGYPVAYEDVCLLELNKLKDKLKNKVKTIGFSGHHLGISVDIAAYILGAEYIERHYTLDKSWKGTDHAASLEPDEFKNLIIELNNVREALTYKQVEILDVEKIQRDKLKFRK